jgi:hypothetical protein
MNCPGHCLMFGRAIRWYRDLPVRYADFGVPVFSLDIQSTCCRYAFREATKRHFRATNLNQILFVGNTSMVTLLCLLSIIVIIRIQKQHTKQIQMCVRQHS